MYNEDKAFVINNVLFITDCNNKLLLTIPWKNVINALGKVVKPIVAEAIAMPVITISEPVAAPKLQDEYPIKGINIIEKRSYGIFNNERRNNK